MGMRSAIRRVVVATPAQRWIWTEPRFVIVGAGRSGTGYISTVLTAAGVKTGHEQWWSLSGNRAIRLKGEASWIATFQLDGYQGRIFHQIRDPIRVVNSIVHGNPGLLNGGTTAYNVRAGWVDLTGNEMRDALAITVAWATKAEEVAEWTWRLEDIDAALLGEICERIGKPISIKRAEHAIASVTTDTNRHVTGGAQIGWDDLPDIPLKAEAMDLGRRYGYL